MRLLDTTTFELRQDSHEFFQAEGYAILSHRWPTGRRLTSPQLDKIRGACEVARNQGLRWLWVDSCCINKASATEEAESINSMFKWYRDARVCVTYLSDVRSGVSGSPPDYQQAVAQEPSMKRGAAAHSPVDHDVLDRSGRPGSHPSGFPEAGRCRNYSRRAIWTFYDSEWTFIGTKAALAAAQISHITGIDADYLTGTKYFRRACIATKMSWAAGRTTTRAPRTSPTAWSG